MDKLTAKDIHSTIVGKPAKGIIGLQNDWWTDIAPDMSRSHGSYLYDMKNNKEYIDFVTFFATSPVAYDHPKIIDKAFRGKLADISIYKPSNSDFWTIEMAEFVSTFRRVANDPPDFNHLFFVSGGSLAVENCLKAAFDWKVRKNIEAGRLKGDLKKLQEEKLLMGDKVICFEQAFHGRTGYTLSMTHTDPRKYMYFPKFDWPRVKNPKIIFPLEENLQLVKKDEEESLNQIRAILDKEPHGYAAIVIESIQGEGGDNQFRNEFFKELRKIADEHEVMLIYDEVQTGMGLTGKMWCYEHFGDRAKPDMIAFGKKFQICGAMANKRIDEVEKNVFSDFPEGKSRINSTFGGNLVDMVRCQKYLEIIEEENLLDHATKMGDYLLDKLLELQKDFPDKLERTRGKGLMIAFNCPTPDMRDKLRDKMQDNGVLNLICGTQTIRFRPHLDITKEEIDKAAEGIRKSLKEI
jgi:L-lysine 6-transaminase